MTRFTTSAAAFALAVVLFLCYSHPLDAQFEPGEPLRIIVFGAHPDDAELDAGGVAALWASRGHQVKFVSMTNGDIGHFEMAGGPLALRRRKEVQECARIFGITTQVLEIHDGELMPTLENRRKVADLIREWQADIVLFHRPYDYHPDHRYTGVLVEDASVIVVAPFFSSETPPVKKNPIFLYTYDHFEKPYPFEPDIVVGIDAVAEQKWSCIGAMPSQFADKHSWQASIYPNVPEDAGARATYLLDLFKVRNRQVADKYRQHLIDTYGTERGSAMQYAEAFQLCQYGSQVSREQLRQLFPIW